MSCAAITERHEHAQWSHFHKYLQGVLLQQHLRNVQLHTRMALSSGYLSLTVNRQWSDDMFFKY